MSNPPDRSALWTNTAQDTSADAAKATAALSDAQSMQAGAASAPEADRDFLARKASEAQFMAQQQLGQAQYAAQQYQAQEFAVRQHNEPIEAALRQAEEQRSAQVLADTGRFVTAAAVTTVAVEAVSNPGMVAGAFGGLMGGTGPATTMSMGPMAMFGALSATPKQLGIEPALDKQLGPVMPAVAIDNVAKASPVVAAEMAAVAAAPVVAEPVERVSVAPIARPAVPMSMQLHNNAMANGPRRPTWADEKPIGGESPGS